MNIEERINKIKDYFVQFNINEQMSYVLVKFPEAKVSTVKYEWNLPDMDEIKEKYDIYIEANQSGIYFVGSLETIENIFNAIDFVIEFNKEQEERIKLFNEKISELKELFGTEDLSELRKLVFRKDEMTTFTPIKIKNGKKKEDKKKEEKKEEVIEVNAEVPVTEVGNNEIVEEDSSMMSIVKSIAEE